MNKIFCIDALKQSYKILGLDTESIKVLGVECNTLSPQDLVPPCINKILSMRSPNLPTPNQNFYLACYLFQAGYKLDDCKKLFQEIFQEEYNEEVADIQLKLIKAKGIEPYSCLMVEEMLGVCTHNCSFCPNQEKQKIPQPFIEKILKPLEQIKGENILNYAKTQMQL